jgi:hypothetical protein
METKIEIALDGRWTMRDRPNRRWQGILRTPSPVAVLLAATSPGRVVWAKSVSYSLEHVVVLDVHELRSPSSAQFILRVGDGWIQNVIVELEHPDVLPACSAPMTIAHGSFQKVFLPQGSPTTALGLVLLPRSSVRVGRTGIWKIRDGFEEQVPPEFSLFASGGRIGDSRES